MSELRTTKHRNAEHKGYNYRNTRMFIEEHYRTWLFGNVTCRLITFDGKVGSNNLMALHYTT